GARAALQQLYRCPSFRRDFRGDAEGGGMSRKVHVIGAGLVGPLMSIYLAKKGFEVTLFERRADMRKSKVERGRSINLAITARGWAALEDVGLKDTVSKISIPMKGR